MCQDVVEEAEVEIPRHAKNMADSDFLQPVQKELRDGRHIGIGQGWLLQRLNTTAWLFPSLGRGLTKAMRLGLIVPRGVV
jgi:hypothetical protein